MRTARFGFEASDQAKQQGHILTASQFHALLTARYTAFFSYPPTDEETIHPVAWPCLLIQACRAREPSK